MAVFVLAVIAADCVSKTGDICISVSVAARKCCLSRKSLKDLVYQGNVDCLSRDLSLIDWPWKSSSSVWGGWFRFGALKIKSYIDCKLVIIFPYNLTQVAFFVLFCFFNQEGFIILTSNYIRLQDCFSFFMYVTKHAAQVVLNNNRTVTSAVSLVQYGRHMQFSNCHLIFLHWTSKRL